jgi:hypothetical protein
MHSVAHKKVLIVLVAAIFGLYDHHRANVTQNVKRLVECSA